MVGAVIDSCITSLLNEKAAVPVRLVLGSALLAYCNYGFVINGDAKLSRVELIPTALSMRRHTSRNSPTLVPSYWEKNRPRRLQTFKRGQGLMSYRKSRVKVTGYNSIYIVGLTNLSLFKSKLTDSCLCVQLSYRKFNRNWNKLHTHQKLMYDKRFFRKHLTLELL